MRYHVQSILDRFNAGEVIKYIFFWGHTPPKGEDIGKFVFSQWYPSAFIIDDVEYKTAEHWMMARKADLFGDREISEKIVKAIKPGEVKELGRQIRNFDGAEWDRSKYDIVVEGNWHKFSQHKPLGDFLIGTQDRVIVEASPVDAIWGIGLSQDEKMIEDPHSWKGLNLLGFALMEVRDRLSSTY